MPLLKCEACGAPLTVSGESEIVVCEYCGVSSIIKIPKEKKINNDVVKFKPPENPLVLSIPSCGSSIFRKKTFNIYTDHAELVNNSDENIDYYISYSYVKTYRYSALSAMIIFRLKNKQKIKIKCLWNSKAKEVFNTLKKLI